jgi:hypothetical protein
MVHHVGKSNRQLEARRGGDETRRWVEGTRGTRQVGTAVQETAKVGTDLNESSQAAKPASQAATLVRIAGRAAEPRVDIGTGTDVCKHPGRVASAAGQAEGRSATGGVAVGNRATLAGVGVRRAGQEGAREGMGSVRGGVTVGLESGSRHDRATRVLDGSRMRETAWSWRACAHQRRWSRPTTKRRRRDPRMHDGRHPAAARDAVHERDARRNGFRSGRRRRTRRPQPPRAPAS